MPIKMERNVFGYFSILVSLAFPVYFLILLIQNIIEKSSVAIYELILPFSLLILFSLPSIMLIFELLQQYSTKLTDVGLQRKVLGNSVVVLWDEVQNVTLKFFILTLETDKKNYVINLFLFKNYKEIVDFVLKNMKNKVI